MVVNRTELVEALQIKLSSSKRAYTKKELTLIVDAFLYEIAINLERWGQVALPALGKFLVTHVPPRTARNPRTGQLLQIPGKKKLVFRASKAIKDQLNQP